jgi:outer membrane protein TolC
LAANLHFNRKIQEVVFAVEKSFYLLDAERANVATAQAIARLAITDRSAVEKSRAEGLATKPDVLLALQREARSRFELESAELGVNDAQADLAVALGVRVCQTRCRKSKASAARRFPPRSAARSTA